MKAAYRSKLADSQLTEAERAAYEQELLAGLTSYTYLEMS
ncbi:MAG: hypothetical protein ABL925_16675 [Methylococcales bacterium]